MKLFTRKQKAELPWEEIGTRGAILAVANWVRSCERHPAQRVASIFVRNRDVAGYDVYLPYSGGDREYLKYLLEHPHPRVKCHYVYNEATHGFEGERR